MTPCHWWTQSAFEPCDASAKTRRVSTSKRVSFSCMLDLDQFKLTEYMPEKQLTLHQPQFIHFPGCFLEKPLRKVSGQVSFSMGNTQGWKWVWVSIFHLRPQCDMDCQDCWWWKIGYFSAFTIIVQCWTTLQFLARKYLNMTSRPYQISFSSIKTV